VTLTLLREQKLTSGADAKMREARHALPQRYLRHTFTLITPVPRKIHNKPIFKHRYEVCTLLVINAWELVLKAYIAKETKSVKLFRKDGTTKPFTECVECVASHLGKRFIPTKYSLEILYGYRNNVAHFYRENLDILVLGLLKASVLFFSGFIEDFIEEHFAQSLREEANLILLPIGFSSPISPLDLISTKSAAKHCSEEVKSFLRSIKKSSDALEKQGITDSIVVNFSIALVNESRIKNADLTAAISNAVPHGNVIAVKNIISAANLTNDASARLIRLSEESVYGDLFTETYNDVARTARQKFEDFIQNDEFNGIMRDLKKNQNIMRTRLLNPKNPSGSSQNFNSKQVYAELAKYYRPRRSS
jgi:hypothetical protein